MTSAILQFSERRGLLIHYLFHELTFNSLSEFHSLSLSLFRKFYLNSLFTLQIHFFSPINYEFSRINHNLLSVSRIHFQFNIFFANSLSIKLFLPSSRIHFI